ncbi:MAG: response regulator [Enterocloster sp.]
MSTKANIIIIEDEKNICSFIERTLAPQGYRVISAYTGKSGLQLIASERPDIILLDLGLPDMDGLEIIEMVRSWSTIPIIVISARTLERSKVTALDLGADDYLTKPFGTAELMARIRTALRHSQGSSRTQASKYEVGELMIDFERRLVKVKGRDVHLTQIEYKLVCLLAQNAGKVMTYESIITKIWGPYADSDNQILRVNMAHIRRKLEENPAEPKYIFTEIGVGYRMREE